MSQSIKYFLFTIAALIGTQFLIIQKGGIKKNPTRQARVFAHLIKIHPIGRFLFFSQINQLTDKPITKSHQFKPHPPSTIVKIVADNFKLADFRSI